MNRQEKSVIDFLLSEGASTSLRIQDALGVSQPTASRLLAGLADALISFGPPRQTRYAVARPIGTSGSQQPIWLIGTDGNSKRIGFVHLLAKEQVLIEGKGVSEVFNTAPGASLPWLLCGLKAQGFLGRLLAKQIGVAVVPANPESWTAESALIGALHTHDSPGALRVGSSALISKGIARVAASDEHAQLDAMASTLGQMATAGSSAGGEQPKLLANFERLGHTIVKFSPPLGTPYGDRWKDLLVAESVAAQALETISVEAAHNEVIETAARVYLVSTRFDRVGEFGRRHVISVGDVHRQFCSGAYANWASSCDELVRKGKLSAADAAKAHLALQFGHLIGNTDMHSGNAGLYVNGSDIATLLAGAFTFAPIYDMLPMRWKPDPALGVFEYEPFDIDFILAEKPALAAALFFWQTMQAHPMVSAGFKNLATTMLPKFERGMVNGVAGIVP